MRKKLILCSAVVALLCSTVMAVPVDYRQSWEGYATGTGDPNYIAEWSVVSGASRTQISSSSPAVGSNGLKVQKDAPYGIMHDLTTTDSSAAGDNPALGAGEVVQGTDADQLSLYYSFDIGLSSFSTADFFMEISLGGAHAPDSSSGAADALAFGWTNGINGSSNHPWVFDGQNWLEATNIATNYKRWHHIEMVVTATQITLIDESSKREDALPTERFQSQTFARQYTGGFDTISARTANNTGIARYADRGYLTGGSIVPEPATLSLLALGGLALLRRRR